MAVEELRDFFTGTGFAPFAGPGGGAGAQPEIPRDFREVLHINCIKFLIQKERTTRLPLSGDVFSSLESPPETGSAATTEDA